MGELTYLALVLAWLPVAALQWSVGWRTLAAQWRPIAVTVSMATLYFGLAGAAAIHNDIWQVDPDRQLPLTFESFVFETWLFFLVTSAVIVQGVVLCFDEDLRDQLRHWLRRPPRG